MFLQRAAAHLALAGSDALSVGGWEKGRRLNRLQFIGRGDTRCCFSSNPSSSPSFPREGATRLCPCPATYLYCGKINFFFKTNFFFSFDELWRSPGLAVVPAAGEAGFPAHLRFALWSLSPGAFLH